MGKLGRAPDLDDVAADGRPGAAARRLAAVAVPLHPFGASRRQRHPLLVRPGLDFNPAKKKVLHSKPSLDSSFDGGGLLISKEGTSMTSACCG